MPSRVLAAASRLVSDKTASCTQQIEKDFATAAEHNDGFQMEYALDFQGSKHLDTSGPFYHGYSRSLHGEPLVDREFDLPGLACANELRGYLLKMLQPNQVVDEFGHECDMSEISLSHLTVLQTKLWTKSASVRTVASPSIQRPSRAQILVAGHVAKIAQLLEDKHIFVLSTSTDHSCEYLKELQVDPVPTCQSQIVRLEPLVHWGTVTPATASQSMFAFRRNGELMKQDAYIHIVRKLVHAEAPTYCVDCVRYLWGKRVEARGTMGQLQCAVKQIDRCQSEVYHPQLILKPNNTGFVSHDVDMLAVVRTVEPVAYHSDPNEESDAYEELGPALPQFDGTYDGTKQLPPGRTNSKELENDAVSMSSDSERPLEHNSESARSSYCKGSFTLALRTTSTSPKSDRSSPLPELDFSTAPSAPQPGSTSTTNVSTAHGSTKSTSGLQIINLITPPRIKQREFGRELNTNVKLRRSPRSHKSNLAMSKENMLPPVQPMEPLKSFSKVKLSAKETKKRKITPLAERTGKQKKARPSTQRESVNPHNVLLDNTDIQPPPLTQIAATANSPAPPELIVNFAKRPANMIIPEGVATLIYEDYLNTSPAPAAKICWCNKPAGYSTYRRNEPPHISQCVNSNCRFKWYHYACLNLSDKGKARFGNLLCQFCRNEREFAEQNKKTQRSGETAIDFKISWTKKGIEREMLGLGGHVPVANAYGLGLEVDLAPARQKQTQTDGTLGSLEKLGYAQSHPYMLDEAYLNPDAYADLRAELAEEEANDQEWWYETRAPEEDYSDVGEKGDDMESEEGL